VRGRRSDTWAQLTLELCAAAADRNWSARRRRRPYSVLVLFIVTKILQSIAILFYALVYGDDNEDDAGLSSGAGTNLKVGGTCQARSAGKRICRAPPLFGFTSTISRFGKRFRVVNAVWSLSCLLFFLLSVPPCSIICKSVGTCPRALDGVSVTFVLQFYTRKHYKTAIQSECIASQELFSHCLRSNLRIEWYFLLGYVNY